MSLEAAVKSLEAGILEQIAAVKQLTEVSQKLLDLRSDAIETVRTAAAPKAAAPKAAAKAAEAPAEPAPVAEKPAAPAAAAETPALDPVQKSIAAYVGQDGIGAEERAARGAKVKDIFGKVGATKASDVPADKAPSVINAMERLLAAGNLIAEAAEEVDLLAA